MIPYRGRVTLEKTINYIVISTDYSYKEQLKTYDFSELRLKLDDET